MLTEDDHKLVHEFKTFLQDAAKLGLQEPTPNLAYTNDPKLRGFEFLHRSIDEMFAHKAAELTHHTGICAAFAKIHSYKYLHDPNFAIALDQEMVSQGIPLVERKEVIEFLPKIVEELQSEFESWGEADMGWNFNLDEIIEASQPPQYE